MRTSGPGRRAHQIDARNPFAFWPIDTAFSVIGGEARLSGTHLYAPTAKRRFVEEPLLSVVPRRPAKEPRDRG